MNEPAPAGSRRVVIALGSAQTLAWGSSYYLPAILAVPMADSFGIPSSWVFGAFSASLILSALVAPAVGRAIDVRGGRGVLALSNLVFAAGLAGLALAPGFWWLAAAWLVMGLAMSLGLYDAAFATLAGLYGRAARAPITGITLIAGFASTVAWPVSALLEEGFGWRGTCLAWAGLHLLLGLPLNRLLVPPAPPPERHAAAAAEAGPPPSRLAMPLLAFVFAATWFIAGAMAAHLPTLLQAAGATSAAAVAAGALIGPAQVAARVAEFGLLRRFHPLVSARLAALGHPLGALVLAVFGGPAAAAFAVLHGMGNGVMTIAKGTLPLAVFGPGGYGARQGLLGAPARLLQSGAPFLFGLLLEAGGVGAALLLTGGLSVAACLALLLLQAAPATPRA
ncbi:MFS transporter [Falsiroseomonas selenitidurans]|uniref:MFS transporter n=1 Tax=Falsiroseomonas selenitidurans TaxID=2716335 RepID=A0ABX1E657_9PROT|nr:MFS transporter [Falsiroseomonas selenitidurans]NKC32561.1 MFS transporter [Falsiroseomonas selenitidurans]